MLNYIAGAGGNVLTINQMIPMNGIAIINLCIQTSHMEMGVDKLVEELTEFSGVNEIQVLARD